MVRAAVAIVLLLSVTMPSMAQDRLPPIPAEKQTPEQRKAAEAFRANRKQDVFGPFVPLHRSPEVMLRAMAMGDYLRYRTVFPTRLNEFIILITARHFTQQYQWYVHYPIALKEGLSRDIVDAIADGRRPAGHVIGRRADSRFLHRAAEEPQRERCDLRARRRALRRAGNDRDGGSRGVLHVSVDGAEHRADARPARRARAEALPEIILNRRSGEQEKFF